MKKSILVIVESPSKAKTIEKYLGENYKVIATMGHLRQLPSKNNVVNFNENEGFQFEWELDEKKFSSIKSNIKNATKVLLATDMDREGEAISWHLETLIRDNKFEGEIKRITFHEITKEAILESLKNPREVDKNLVDAYLVRIGLDYSIGFIISPILWKKLPFNNLSAGRVQSPTLGFITSREIERINFVSETTYSLLVNLKEKKSEGEIVAQLISYKEKELDEKNKEEIEKIQQELPREFILNKIEKKVVSVSFPLPFTTSTLQQEASKLGFNLNEVMRIAQDLYEGIEIDGEQKALITYMRTDSINMNEKVIENIRKFLKENYADSLPENPNKHKSKVKNTQEAHECIRPTDIFITPSNLKNKISEKYWKLYNLIWTRTIACQMLGAKRSQETMYFNEKNSKDFLLKSNYSRITFKGFMNVYNEPTEKEENIYKEKMEFDLINSNIKTHITEPPARFSEATMVQKMEACGIGRPSTYASIIETLIKRDYINRNKYLIPSLKGELVLYFLKEYCKSYVDAEFTAKMEELLDDISNGKKDYQHVLRDFLKELRETVEKIEKEGKIEILKRIGCDLLKDLKEVCSTCKGPLEMRYKYNVFFYCENCKTNISIEKPEETKFGEITLIKKSTYSLLTDGTGKKVFIPSKIKIETEKEANVIFSLPKSLDNYKDLPVFCGISKLGFYFKYNNKFYGTNLEEIMNFSTKTIEEKLENEKSK
jgi:DNA topoisomerase-1